MSRRRKYENKYLFGNLVSYVALGP
jgi:hypothetical protein